MTTKAAAHPAGIATGGPGSAGVPPPAGALADVPVVGIGASAGGLEACTAFFRHVRPDSGIAYVVVSHLDPDHPSALPQILQHATALPVVEATDQMTVLPDRVHVIPPNRDMDIVGHTLRLSPPDQPPGRHMPIDHFLRALAEAHGAAAVGIILSGSGTDGTLGLRAIYGAGGVGLVQEPATAKYDGMPRSAVRSGYATHVLAVESMPELLHEICHRRLARRSREITGTTAGREGLDQIMALLHSATGHDFSRYKKAGISRRISLWLAQHGIDDAAAYACHLRHNPRELQVLFNELLIRVTSFFRDPEAFVALGQALLPRLLARAATGPAFRVWVAGCSTGEEAYSIAILLDELTDGGRCGPPVEIFATDLSAEAIASARAGRYPPAIAQELSPERLQRFFLVDGEGGFRVRPEIRERVVFAVHSVSQDPPLSGVDLLSCRNLLIYLEPELQAQLVAGFHRALNPDGLLLLSTSENLPPGGALFAPVSRRWKLYRALPRAGDDASAASARQPADVAEIASRVLRQAYVPPSVLADLQGNIVYVHGDIAPYLRPHAGESLRLADAVRPGLAAPLRAAMRAVIDAPDTTVRRDALLAGAGHRVPVCLCLRSVPHPASGERLILVSFEAAPARDPGAETGRGAAAARVRKPGRRP